MSDVSQPQTRLTATGNLVLPAAAHRCRFCSTALEHTFVDLGMSPLCESYISRSQLDQMEAFYPLHVYVCGKCFLVQLMEYVAVEEIFDDYAYFSSYSDSWLDHSRRYVDMAIDRFQLGQNSQVIEIASNDGYLLQYFVQRNIPALGIEPAANVARVAQAKGIDTKVMYFGESTAAQLVQDGLRADLLLGNNVLAQVPNLNGFVRAMKILLAPQGVITMEFPHLQRLVEGNQFDTIYHEHFDYFSLLTVQQLFAAHGLVLFDVEELSTHGGSLRIYARHDADDSKPVTSAVSTLLQQERAAGYDRLETYLDFEPKVVRTKHRLLEFLIGVKGDGKRVVGYGAPGKGNTLLNYCGIRTDFLDYTVDRNPHKQGKHLPGSRIPICDPERIAETRPDLILILPWNLKDEIMNQLAYTRDFGARFVVAIPELTVY